MVPLYEVLSSASAACCFAAASALLSSSFLTYISSWSLSNGIYPVIRSMMLSRKRQHHDWESPMPDSAEGDSPAQRHLQSPALASVQRRVRSASQKLAPLQSPAEVRLRRSLLLPLNRWSPCPQGQPPEQPPQRCYVAALLILHALPQVLAVVPLALPAAALKAPLASAPHSNC